MAGRAAPCRAVCAHLGAALSYALTAFDDERVRRFVRNGVLAQLAEIDVARFGGQLLDVLTSGRRHQGVLDAMLRKFASVLNDETLQARMAEVVASEVKYLRVVGLDHVAGRYATAKMIAGVINLIGEMAEDPNHPLRLQFDEFVVGFIRRLKEDPELRARVEVIKERPADAAGAGHLPPGPVDRAGRLGPGRLGERGLDAAPACRCCGPAGGEKLQSDTEMQGWINEQLMLNAPRFIERYREDIRLYIIARVGDWNTKR